MAAPVAQLSQLAPSCSSLRRSTWPADLAAALVERMTGLGLEPATAAWIAAVAAAVGAALSWGRIERRVDALVIWLLLAALPAGSRRNWHSVRGCRATASITSPICVRSGSITTRTSPTTIDCSAWSRRPICSCPPSRATRSRRGRSGQAWSGRRSSRSAMRSRGTDRHPIGAQDRRHVVSLSPGRMRGWTRVGTVGPVFTYRLSALFVAKGWAATGMVAVAVGSFLLWYLVKEPSMTHAPSMAAVAAFTWAWAATRGRRTLWQWTALGLLAGLMGTIRWQNVTVRAAAGARMDGRAIPLLRTRAIQPLRTLTFVGLAFTVAAVVGFAPQMLVWKAIYGHYLAVSPVGPQIRWWAPHLSDILWSSRNGLFATSPILYVGAIGLLLMVRDRRRRLRCRLLRSLPR